MKSCYAVISLFFVFFFAAALPAQCPITVSAGEDIYLCAPPTPTQLNGSIDGDYLSFTWSPTTGMSGANTLNPTVNVSQTTTYVLSVKAADFNNNLIVNGDFEQGNVGFTSDYVYNPGDLVPEGYYDVLDNPQDDHPGFAPCDDHTSGSGNMMVVNGAGTPNQNVWCQTVSVTPNTQYVFSAWVTSVVAASPALLQFSINGSPLGNIFSAPSGTCNWQNFFQTWNSGGSGSATICIVNQNTTLGGNDFALDDIVFAPTCTVTDTVKVTVVSITAIAAPVVAFIPCEGSNITLSGAGSSVGANISYNWDSPDGNIVSGQNTLSPVVNAPGTYTLTVTYDNGFVECTKTATVNVVLAPNQLAAWITPPSPLGCGAPTITLLGNSSQPAFSTYQWTTVNGNIVSGQNAKNAVVNAPGTYTLLVTNTATGCTATADVVVTTATNPPTANASVSDTITCSQPTASLSGAGSSMGANITYAWTTSNGNIVSGQNAQNAIAGAGGTYVLAVTNTSNNCTAYDTVVVAANVIPPVVSIQPPGNLDCDTDTLTLFAAVSPNNATVLWGSFGPGIIVSGINTLTPKVITAGIYDITATNPANGCTSTASVTVISDYTPPVAVVQPADSITCQSPSVTLSGNGSSSGGNFTYNWTAAAGGNIVSGQNTLSPVVNAAGTYTLFVTNIANACTASASVAVVADANVVVAIANAPDSLDCAINSVIINANGSSSGPTITYFWTTANGNITGGANTPTPAVNAPGTYQLLLTNTVNGCSATDLAIVVLDTVAPNIQITQPDTLTCANPTQTIQAQNFSLPGNFNYTWTTALGGNIVSGDDTLHVVVNAPGIYALVTTNLVNGCSAADSVFVFIETGTPVAVAASPGALTCAQPTQILTSNGSSVGANFTYNWTTTNGNITAGANTPAPTVNQPGDYNLLITNISNGCTATTSASVLENKTAPLADAGFNGILTCFQPVFSLLANNGQPLGNLNFSWSTPDGHIIGKQDTIEAECDQAGLYVLQVTDPANGCSATDSVKIIANQQAPSVTIKIPSQLTCTTTTLTLDASVSPGVNLNYDWTASGGGNIVNGQNTLQPLVDEPGMYILTVNDLDNGCSATSQVTVNQNIAPPPAGIAPPGTLTCAVTNLSLSGMPASGNFTWQWQTTSGNIVAGANTSSPLINQPGDYTLVVTDSQNGCSAAAFSVVIQDLAAPIITATAPQTLTCSVLNVPINGTVTQPGSGFTAFWATTNGHFVSGQNALNAIVDAPGDYVLTIQNMQNGCTATAQATVFQNITPPMATAVAVGEITCTTLATSLDGTGSSAGANFTYAWSGPQITGGQNTLTPAVAAAGTYVLTVTDQSNGCTATAQAIVGQNTSPPDISIAPPESLTCMQFVTTLSANLPSSITNFLANWTTTDGNFVSGQNDLNAVVDQPGIYFLIVINWENGCTQTAQTVVLQNIMPPGADAGAAAELHCNQPAVTLQGSSPSAGNLIFAWATIDGHLVSGAATPKPLADESGTYALTVTNPANGCTSTDAVVVTEIPPPTFEPVLLQPDCHDLKGSVELDAISGGTPPFKYSVNGGQTFQNQAFFNNLPAGFYDLVLSDAHGCTAETSIELKLPFVPTVTLPEFTLIELGDAVQLEPILNQSASNIISWQWSPADGLSCSDCPFPVASPLHPTIYTLKIIDLNGCEAQAKIQLRVDRRRQLYAPNVFSPNGDGLNDTFTLFGKGVTEIRSLQIFDRWGTEIFIAEHFQPNDESLGWGGTFRGTALNPAVFVWQAIVVFVDGEAEIFAGDVLLSR